MASLNEDYGLSLLLFPLIALRFTLTTRSSLCCDGWGGGGEAGERRGTSDILGESARARATGSDRALSDSPSLALALDTQTALKVPHCP